MVSPQEHSAEWMTAYLDAELDPEQVETYEAFLADSPQARAELEDLRKMLSLVGGLAQAAAPEDFYEKLHRRIRRKDALSLDSSWLTLMTLPFQALSILVILAIAVLYMMAQLDQPGELQREAAPPSAQP